MTEHGSTAALPGVVERPVTELRAWPGNPRRIAAERLDDLKRAMTQERELLGVRPLLVDREGQVWAGNFRLLAAQELGWETIPALEIDVDPERAQLWGLLDNGSFADWHEPSLAELIAGMADRGLDLALTGLGSADLDRVLARLAAPKDPDAAPTVPTQPESQPGEIYRLGPHRLMCGDARDPEQVAALLAGEQAELLWTDPPYGVAYTGKTRDRLTICNDDAAGVQELLEGAFASVDQVLRASARFYVCSPAGPQGTLFRLAIEKVGWHFHQSLVWAKGSPVLGHADHLFGHEDVLYGYKKSVSGRPGRGRHPGSRWYGPNNASTLFFHDRPARSAEHPTMKPVELIKAMLTNSSLRGDPVLDPFCGSGSTLIACEQLGRCCYAMEIDPGYVDVVRRRYQQLVADG